MNQFLQISRVIVPLLVASSLAACKDDTPTAPNGRAAIVRPGIGTAYTFRNVELDSLGREIASSATTYNVTVVDTGLTHRGKTGLTLIEEKEGRFFIAYESTGDISLAPDTTVPGMDEIEWITLPFGTRRTIAGPSFDTTVNDTRFIQTLSYAYVGDESLTTPAGTFAAQRVRRTIRFIISIGALSDTTESRNDVWFVPAIGYIAKSQTLSPDGSSGFYGSVDVLTSYSLK